MSGSLTPTDAGREREVTGLLEAWANGREGAREAVFDLVYPQLKALAANRLAAAPFDRSIAATELVHEAYLVFRNQRRLSWEGRTHFFAFASTVIRRILVDRARHRLRDKRGGKAMHLRVDDLQLTVGPLDLDLLDLDEALGELARIRASVARIVELRAFGGLSLEEAGRALGISRATVARRWRFARAWLARRLGGLS